MSATVMRRLEKIPQKAQQKPKSGPPSCSHSGKAYTDISHSEFRNRNYVCGDCGARFRLSEADAAKVRNQEPVVVPRHDISSDLHQFRKSLERQEKVRSSL